tara:strand:+ start:26 stop:643 length:618 start_codon:yes stop_codon:yes gene_type:complete
MKKISILNYGMGNLWSLITLIEHLQCKPNIINNYKDIKKSDRILLPGVGSFPMAMKKIKENNFLDGIKEHAIEKKKPILGICLGMQLLCKSSTEEKFSKGLGLVDLKIDKFKKIKNKKKYHIGFNQVKDIDKSLLFNGINKKNDFYFVHAYRATGKNLKNIKLLKCSYNEEFIAGFEKQNIFGTQFHPEKSHKNGIILLKNFFNL